jgi:dihydroxyacetone kinase
MSSTNLLNERENVVVQSLEGFCYSQGHLALDRESKVIFRRDIAEIRERQVTLVSGGGSGHEPSHIGFVGKGMLSAVVCGEVFASPSAWQVQRALELVGGAKGTLVIVKNYTGDRVSFGRALERVRSVQQLAVELVIVDDDRAIDELQTSRSAAGRRGLAGTVFVHKVAGYLAEEGFPLDQVAHWARRAAGLLGTVGFGVVSGEVELGRGIHGEQGFQMVPLESSESLVQRCLSRIVSSSPLCKGDNVAILVNNLGATSHLEMGVIVRDTVRWLLSEGFHIQKLLTGPIMTSLDMVGASFSILPLTEPLFLEALNSHTQASAWTNACAPFTSDVCIPQQLQTSAPTATQNHTTISKIETPLNEHEAFVFKECVLAACQVLLDIEQQLTNMDIKVGDGDCGHTLAKGASAILIDIREGDLNISAGQYTSAILSRMSAILDSSMGGSSGAFYCIWLDSASASFHSVHSAPNDRFPAFSRAFHAGIENIQKYGGANLGDRTMLDTLIPIAQKMVSVSFSMSLLKELAELSLEAAQRTADIPLAQAGRSSYLSKGVALGTPDPGAYAAGAFLNRVFSLLGSLTIT